MNSNNLTIVTSFPARMYEDPHCQVVESVRQTYPGQPFFIYHENSVEREGTITDPKIPGSTFLDLFTEIPWANDFMKTSPFATAHLNESIWNRHSVFWFRKVLALHHAAQVCKTPLMVWLDCDTYFHKPFDYTALSWFAENDACFIFQPPGHFDLNKGAIESGVISFNMAGKGKQVIEAIVDEYRSLRAFEYARWDDGAVMTHIHDNGGYGDAKIGGLTHDCSPLYIFDYIMHHRGPMLYVRPDRQEFSPVSPEGWQ